MTHTVYYYAALAVALGMCAQTLAARLRIPSIVILLATGVLAGPGVSGLLEPAAFGTAREDLVTLVVTVILFEGGLALRIEDLRRQQRSLALLLTVGACISMATGAVAAWGVLGLSGTIALLYGALVIVTGPTVVTPLLSRLTIDRPVRELLIGEGVLIDPVGAIVAIVTAEYVMGRSAAWEVGWLVVTRLGLGAVAGSAAGAVLAWGLRRRWIPDDLRNPAVLGGALIVAALASHVSSEAGLMAAVAQGVVMGNARLPELGRLRQFKEEITTLLLSFLFVILAADLSLDTVRALGWRALAVVAILAWVGRPLAVFLCTIGSGLSLRERLFVAWLCPRGIVAASVAGLFAILLQRAQMPGGPELEGLVFVTVAATVTVQGLLVRPVARWLGVDAPRLGGTIIVGADAIGRLLAHLLLAYGRQVVLIDLNPSHGRAAHAEGLAAYEADARSVDALEAAGARYADTVIALTRNPELNTLIGQRVRENFRIERVLAITSDPEAKPSDSPLPGDFPGLDEVNRQLRLGRIRVIEYEAPGREWAPRPAAELAYGPAEFALLQVRQDRVYVATGDQVVAPGDRLVCVQAAGDRSPLESSLTVLRRFDYEGAAAGQGGTPRSGGSSSAPA